jgi:hypothetical protein
MTTQLEQIATKAKVDRALRFTSLAHLLTPAFLIETWRQMNRHGASGVDGETTKEFERELEIRVQDIHARLKAGTYQAPPVRRVEIPKGPGKVGTRPLGIPTVEDRLVQRAVARILEAVFEADFLDCSYGFRRGRSPHHALRTLRATLITKKVRHLYEADIRGYFNHINHQWLMRMVAHRIADGVILRLIGKWLRAGVMQDGVVVRTEAGTPQGGPLSPLLANVYLHFGAPGQTWCFQRVKFPSREEVQPPHRESSLGSEEVTNRTKRRQSDERAVTKVKRLSLVKYLTAGRQHRSGWEAPVGTPQTARWPETAAGSVSTARSEMEASRDLGDPLGPWSASRADRVCRTIRIIPEKGRCDSAKSDSLVVLRARESRAHGEAAKQRKTDFRETSPAPTEAGI